MTIEKDEAITLLEQEEKSYNEQMKKYEAELATIKSTLASLKKKLYEKFKQAINLEDDDE